jgi:HK97 gp10 family phage protein
MREFSDLGSFAKFITEELTSGVKGAREMALEAGAQMIRDEAKHVIGTYEFEWPQLAPATQADREAKGYPANEPLLRTGEMRDSITYTIVTPGELAEIGSNSDIAVYQELGTATIPARPFLLSSAFYKEKAVARMIRDVVGAAVAGRSINGEIAKLIAEAIKDVGKTARELVEPNDETTPRDALNEFSRSAGHVSHLVGRLR